MKKSGPATNAFAVIVGIFLLIEGIWGLSSNVIFGVLTTNRFHAVVHILLGVASIVLGLGKRAKGYLLFLGILLLVVGILHFVPGASDAVHTIFNVNTTVAIFNIVIGILSITAAYAGTPEKTHVPPAGPAKHGAV